MDNLIITSADGHAVIPPKLWAEYLDKKYHKYLDLLRSDKEMFGRTVGLLHDRMLSPEAQKVFDLENAYGGGGWEGLWDLKTRLREMDREGIAAEFVFPGDQHALDLFWNTTNSTYAVAAADAGAQAYNRWSHDEFGSASDRLLLVGAPTSGHGTLDLSLSEADWMADHGFAGVYTPGFCAFPGQVPVYDIYWDKLWASYAERKIVLITHAGWGLPQGFMHAEMAAVEAEVAAEGGDQEDVIIKLSQGLFNDKGVFADLRSRQGMWYLMLSGVFDRHPKLKVMVTEIRVDWLPATLRLLDRVWEANRDRLPAKRRPSEYWATNCMAGLSFLNKAEVKMRHEIGVSSMAFGRDYPHTEATWPNTLAYLSDMLRGVPESEVRAILGENMVRFLGLDRDALAKIAARIAPTYRQLADAADLEPALKAHLDRRCGYSTPSEGDSRIQEAEALLKADLSRIAVAGLAFAA
jgi:predicted TIM-barrel fold metal-dependent hydrolase